MCEKLLIFVLLTASAAAEAIVKDEKSANIAISKGDSSERRPIDLISKNISTRTQVLGETVQSNLSLPLLNSTPSISNDNRWYSIKSAIEWTLLKQVTGGSSPKFVVSMIRRIDSAIRRIDSAIEKMQGRVQLMLDNFNRSTDSFNEPIALLLKSTVNSIGRIFIWVSNLGNYIIDEYVRDYAHGSGKPVTHFEDTSSVLTK